MSRADRGGQDVDDKAGSHCCIIEIRETNPALIRTLARVLEVPFSMYAEFLEHHLHDMLLTLDVGQTAHHLHKRGMWERMQMCAYIDYLLRVTGMYGEQVRLHFKMPGIKETVLR